MTPHPDEAAIIFLDYDVIIFDDVNPLGYCDVINALRPWRRTPTLPLPGFFPLVIFTIRKQKCKLKTVFAN